MPPRGVRTFGDSPADWYKSLPPVTRIHATICVATTVAFALSLVNPYSLMLTWGHIRQFQLWRLVTNFSFVGKFSFNFVILMFWILHYGAQLESSTYQHNTADYLYMYLVGMAAMDVISLLIPFFRIGFCSTSLIFMLAYVWSKNFATQNVSLYGLLTVQGFYLPFCLLAFSVMVGGNWVADVLGILGGHLYYFLKVIHPAAGGASLVETPIWMCAPGRPFCQ